MGGGDLALGVSDQNSKVDAVKRDWTDLYAAIAPQQTTRPYGFIRLSARSRISPPTKGSASTHGRKTKGRQPARPRQGRYAEGSRERTIIKININQPLFPQFLLEPGLCIIENSMTTQFLQLFDFGGRS
jgi:hypothetical protein